MQTPSEVGAEWLEKVIRVHPEKGELEPYAKMGVRIDCRGKVLERNV